MHWNDLIGSVSEAVPEARAATIVMRSLAHIETKHKTLAEPALQEGSMLELGIRERGGVVEARKRLVDLNERIRELEVRASQLDNDSEWPKFSEEQDDNEVTDALFNSLDADKSSSISVEELYASLKGVDKNDEDKEKVLKCLMEGCSSISAKSITREEFRKALCALPRVCGERVHWAKTLNLDVELARFLKLGSVMDGLKGLKKMADHELEQHISEVCSKFGAILPSILRYNLRKLRSTNAKVVTNARDYINSKFSLDGAYVGRYATLEDFYNGPEALIGTPNPNIEKGMETEHCFRENAKVEFRTTNYNIVTYPQLEWEFVVDPKEGTEYPHTPSDKSKWKPDKVWSNENPDGWKGDRGRDPIRLEAFLGGTTGSNGLELFSPEEVTRLEEARKEVKRAGLKKPEVLGLRLYTGPLFVTYNAVLRGFPQSDVENLRGNKFETSIFVIASGITKLSKVTGIPENRCLYRGLGGMILPRQFWDRYDECQVTVRMEVGRSAIPDLLKTIQKKITSGVELQESGKNDIKVYDIGNKFFQIHLPALNKVLQGNGLIRVVKEPYESGEAALIILGFPMSKHMFEDYLLDHFVAAIRRQICKKECEIEVVEVANKPYDFRGGGTQPNLMHPSAHSHEKFRIVRTAPTHQLQYHNFHLWLARVNTD